MKLKNKLMLVIPVALGLVMGVADAHPACEGDDHCAGVEHESAELFSGGMTDYVVLSDEYTTYTISPVTSEHLLDEVVLSNCNTGLATMAFSTSVSKNDTISATTAADLPASAGIVSYIYMDLQAATGAAEEAPPIEEYSVNGGLMKRQSSTNSPMYNHGPDWPVTSCTIKTLTPYYTKTTASATSSYRECRWKCQHYYFNYLGVRTAGTAYPWSTCGVGGTINGSSTAHSGVSINESNVVCPKTGVCADTGS